MRQLTPGQMNAIRRFDTCTISAVIQDIDSHPGLGASVGEAHA